MKIGAYQLTAVNTGFVWLDGGAMFGTVPKVLWNKTNPADDQNRIQLAMRALLIEGEGRKIIVDCGSGDKGGEKFKEMFNLAPEKENVELALASRGIKPEEITDVILTHLHFDHAGASTKKKQDGTYTATFPNATYYIQEKNLQLAQKPNPRERVSYIKEIFEALLVENKLKLVRGNAELFPGISVFVSQGHTEAQQHPVITDGKTTLFYGGDLIPTKTHVPLPWVMGYDLHPLTMIEEKKVVLSLCEKTDLILFFEHDPFVPATRIQKSEKGYVAGDAVSFL